VVLVSAKCAPITAATFVESSHVAGGFRSSVDCSVNPAAFVGQERMSSWPLGLAFKEGNSPTPPMSATVPIWDAAIAVTPLKT
jgi:hypothetical protein